MQRRSIISIDNTLFKPLLLSLEEVDVNSLLYYTNMLDAMIDTTHFSMEIAIAITIIMVRRNLDLQEEVNIEMLASSMVECK